VAVVGDGEKIAWVVVSVGERAVARGLHSDWITPWGSCGMQMRRSEGKAESRMLVARREVARHEIGSGFVKGKGVCSAGVRVKSEEAVGIGPACDRSSKWRY
jgi:hypothetical protein